VIKQETQEGRSAIQNLLNWRKLNEGHAAGEGKIGGTLSISRSPIWSKANRWSHVSKFGPLSSSIDCFLARPTAHGVGFQVRTLIFSSWNGRNYTTYCPYDGQRSPSTRIRFLLLCRSRGMLRSIPTGSMR